jgi:acyl-CoA dehydrogenase
MPRALFDDEHEAYRESFRSFLALVVTPDYPHWQQQGTIPRHVFGIAGKHGVAAMPVPEEHGGAGIDDFRFNVVLAEEAMMANLAGFALMLATHNDVCVPVLVAAQHPALDAVAAGELIAAWVPPGHVEGRDGRLSGAATGVVNGGLADILLVGLPDGVAVVDAGAVSREPSAPLVGMRACDRADLVFEAAAFDAVAAEAGAEEPLSTAVLAVAGARAALSWTIDYVKERRAFGIPVARFQNTQDALAEVASELEATQALVDACVLERNVGGLSEVRAAAAKLRATAVHDRAVDWGVQLHGGYGYMLEYPIAHAFADARYLRLHGVDDAAMRARVAQAIGL